MFANPYEVIVTNIRKARECLIYVVNQLEMPNSNATKCINILQSKISKDMIDDTKKHWKNVILNMA